MSRRAKWSESEDEILLRAIKDCPNNLSEAFIAASQLIDRSVGACSNRWYSCISKRTDRNSVALMCFSSKTYNINRKNCKTPIERERVSGFRRVWNSILNIFCSNE